MMGGMDNGGIGLENVWKNPDTRHVKPEEDGTLV
jgi:hypothetical protein